MKHCRTCTCSDLSEKVLSLWLSGLTMADVSKAMRISPSYISNMIHEQMALRGHVVPEGINWTRERANEALKHG